jgi:hypothetical protein
MEAAHDTLSRDELESRLALAESRLCKMAQLQDRLKSERVYRRNATKACQVMLGALEKIENQVLDLKGAVLEAASTLPVTINDAGLMQLFISKFQEELQVSLIQSGQIVKERVRLDQRLVVRLGLASDGRAAVSTDELSVIDVRFDTLRSMLKDLGVSYAPRLKFRCTAAQHPPLEFATLTCAPWVIGASTVAEFVVEESSCAPTQFVIDSHTKVCLKGRRQPSHTIAVTLDVPGPKWREAMARLGCVDLLPPTAVSQSYTLGTRSHKKQKLSVAAEQDRVDNKRPLSWTPSNEVLQFDGI